MKTKTQLTKAHASTRECVMTKAGLPRALGKWLVLCLAAFLWSSLAFAQRIETLSPQVRKYVRVESSKVILQHVQVIDGTGAAPAADRNVLIDGGKITAITPGADLPPVEGAAILNLRGYSVMPGIVGMHEHSPISETWKSCSRTASGTTPRNSWIR